MLTGIYSLLGACWMTIMDAPDVAFTEAAVGAGISTVLMLGTLTFMSQRKAKRTKSGVLPFIVAFIIFIGWIPDIRMCKIDPG